MRRYHFARQNEVKKCNNHEVLIHLLSYASRTALFPCLISHKVNISLTDFPKWKSDSFTASLDVRFGLHPLYLKLSLPQHGCCGRLIGVARIQTCSPSWPHKDFITCACKTCLIFVFLLYRMFSDICLDDQCKEETTQQLHLKAAWRHSADQCCSSISPWWPLYMTIEKHYPGR